MTLIATICLEKFLKEVFTGCIASELGMLVCGGLKSKDTKYELSSTLSIVSSFLKNFFFSNVGRDLFECWLLMKIYIFQYLRYGTIQRVYGQFREFSMDLSPCQILTECKNILLSNLMFSVLQQHLLYFEQFHCLLLLGQLVIVCNAKCYITVFQIN